MVFVTHFERLVQYLSTFPSVKQVTLQSRAPGREHCVVEGYRTLDYSGAALARTIELPTRMIDLSYEILERVRKGCIFSNVIDEERRGPAPLERCT